MNFRLGRMRRRMQGRTLVELMIAITLGMILTVALIAVYLSTATSSRQATAISRMNEDAAVALSLISAQLRMAGFSIPRKGVSPASALVGGVKTSAPDRNFIGAGIRACDQGFTNSTAAFKDLSCATASSGAAAFSVRFEGADAGGTDSFRFLLPPNIDCLGQSIDAGETTVGALGDAYPLVESRFWVAANPTSGTSDLSCAGNGSTNAFTGKPLVQNVQDMRLRFGIAKDGQSSEVVQYINEAADVDKLGGTAEQNWSRVVTVRLCLLMRSAAASPADAGGSYVDCDGKSIPSNDGFIRRAYTQTVALRNRGGFAGTTP
jgi:type IV pilus assembly protein PilW